MHDACVLLQLWPSGEPMLTGLQLVLLRRWLRGQQTVERRQARELARRERIGADYVCWRCRSPVVRCTCAVESMEDWYVLLPTV